MNFYRNIFNLLFFSSFFNYKKYFSPTHKFFCASLGTCTSKGLRGEYAIYTSRVNGKKEIKF